MATALTPSPLSHLDLDRLSRDSGPKARALTAHKIARFFAQKHVPDRERALAADILRRFSFDPEVKVRQVLATDLKDYPLLPRDIAMKLAGDVAEVATPVLSASQALTEDDLILAIERGSPACHQAIAKRPKITTIVAGTLARQCDRQTVLQLLANGHSTLNAETTGLIWRRFPEDGDVLRGLSHRPGLPPTMALSILPDLAPNDRDHVVTYQALPDGPPTPFVMQSRRRLCHAYEPAGTADRAGLAQGFHRAKRLGPLLAMRALCLGDHRFFETALGLSVGLAARNTAILVHGANGQGLPEIYGAARMPDKWLPVAQAAIAVIGAFGGPNKDFNRNQYRDRLIDSLLSSVQARVDADILSFLLSPVDKLVASG
jgi:hypothetical protein